MIGCASPRPPPPPKPSILAISVVASGRLNPDARSRPSPVVLRIYELKSSAQFESADFLSLYEKDQSVLAADIVVRDEMVIRPGDNKSLNKALSADAKFIGVIAAFRELERARWRGVLPLVAGKDNFVTISLDDVMVQASGSAR